MARPRVNQTVRVQVQGLKETFRAMENVKQGVRNRVLRKASRAGFKPVLAAARSLAPVDTGWQKRSLGVRIHTGRKSGVVSANIGARTKQEATKTDKRGRSVKRYATKYTHLIHKGTHRSRAQPFLKQAFDQTQGQVVSIMRREIGVGVDAEVKRYAAKGKSIYRGGIVA
jgi:HK97 gp10 family phage protein